jgi:hypothetical protein
MPAGEFCDVDVRLDLVYADRSTVFGDPADPDRVIVRARGTVSYTNLSTGATATDDGRFVFTIENGGTLFTLRGLHAKLRDGDGRLVDVAAGRVVFDDTTGELVSFTPNTALDYAAVVCEMLGAEPAA